MSSQDAGNRHLAAIGRLLILLTFFGLWEWVAATRLINPVLIGRPTEVFKFLFNEIFVTGSLLIDLQWTLLGVALAFSLGTVAGALVGLLFATRPFIEAIFSPIVTALNAMPRIALAPLFLIWFGLGLGSKVALGFSLTFFVVLASTVAGARSINPDHVTLARTLGASGVQIFRTFTLPNAVPVMFAGLRLGLIVALLGVVGGEIIAAEHGLGQTLALLAANFRTSGVFAVIILLAIIGVIVTWVMDAIENRLLRWR
jgi:NitT/TauT family transport system permease protein